MNTQTPTTVDTTAIRRLLEAHDSARTRVWLNICSSCGLCAESCFFYLANDRDPRLSPAYKFKATFGEMVRRKGQVDRAFLERCHDILWGQCTTCKRCSLYCPFGIDVATMISLGRTICHSQGIVPKALATAVDNYARTGNQMGLSQEDFLETCQWMAEEAGEEMPGLTIPIDKANPHVVYTVNPREPAFYPLDLAQAAKIFTVAEENWTLPSTGWDCTNLPMFAGDRALAGKVVRTMYEKAIALGAKRIVLTECGHALRSAAFEGPYLAGYADGRPPIEIVHSVQLFHEYLRDGRIRIDPTKRLREPVTYQDPCNVSRNGGLWEQARELLGHLVTDFRDMTPNREHNHCCGGGGGYMPMGPEFKKRRMISGRVKAEQIEATGAKIVVTSCHNCFDQINDLSKEYQLGVRAVSFKDLICDAMIVPDRFKPPADHDGADRPGGAEGRDGE